MCSVLNLGPKKGTNIAALKLQKHLPSSFECYPSRAVKQCNLYFPLHVVQQLFSSVKW